MSLPRYEPMLADRWPRPFSSHDWWFEVKWDGYRVLVEYDRRLTLLSRRGKDLTPAFPELVGFELDRPTVLDGEIVVLDENGVPDFSLLQQRGASAGHRPRPGSKPPPATLIVFDLLHHGEPLVRRPIEDRWERLESLALQGVARSEPVRGEGEALFDSVVARGLEGVVAKAAGSRYQSGGRSPDWRKISHRLRVRAVVGGFTPGEGGRSGRFGALQVGLFDADRLRYIGGVGTGFDDRSLQAIRVALDELRAESSPFESTTGIPADAVWVEPALVAVVEAAGWTAGGRLRAPSFVGFSDEPVESTTWASEGP